MVHCVIHLDNLDRDGYYAGETVSGSIEVFLKRPAKFRGLSFVVYGAAQCHWTETRTRTVGSGKNRRSQTYTVSFDGKEAYLNSKVYLFGHSGAEAIELPTGTHKYGLSFQIPPLVPASLEACHGNVRYHVEAVLDVPWGFDKECIVGFKVLRNEDLNHYPELKFATRNEEIKHFCFLCRNSEPFIMTVTLPYSGFVPGQDIPITIKYDNKSDVEIPNTRIVVRQVTRFNSSTPSHKTKVVAQKILEEFVGGVNTNQNKVYEKIIKLPPNMDCSNSSTCNVVQVGFQVEVEAKVSGCHSDVELITPITIGNIPLDFGPTSIESVQPTFQTSSAPSEYSSNGFGSVYQPSAPTPALDLPPSFDEAVKMTSPKYRDPESDSKIGWVIPDTSKASAESSAPLLPSGPQLESKAEDGNQV